MRTKNLRYAAIGVAVLALALGYWWQSRPPAEAVVEFQPEPEPTSTDSILWIQDGIRNPAVQGAQQAAVPDSAPVIGVVVRGEPRAYWTAAMETPVAHVVNDVLGGIPVSVTYCDHTDCARVFTDPASTEPLPIQVGGRHGEMLLRLEGIFYPHSSERIPLEDVEFERTTWGQWRAKHAQSTIFVGAMAGTVPDGFAGPAAVVRAYLEAGRWQDRLAFVHGGERLRPAMERRYKNQWIAATYDQIAVEPEWPSGQRRTATVHNFRGIGQLHSIDVHYVVVRDRDQYRIDWEASLGQNRISIADFVASRAAGSRRFRILCALDDYYARDFVDRQNQYLSFRMYDTDASRSPVQGYAKRGSPEGRALARVLRDGRVHPLTLQLANLSPSGATPGESDDVDAVLIVGVASTSF